MGKWEAAPFTRPDFRTPSASTDIRAELALSRTGKSELLGLDLQKLVIRLWPPATLTRTIVCLSACLWESAMRGIRSLQLEPNRALLLP